MAKTTETRIYKAAYELLMNITQLVGSFPRNRRHVGDRLFKNACELVECVFQANVARDKVPLILRVKEYLVSIQVSLRLSSDLRLISPRQFGTTVETATEVSKQASGWLAWAEARA